MTSNTANNNAQYGFYLHLSSNNTLTSNTANNNGISSIYISDGSINNVLSNNNFEISPTTTTTTPGTTTTSSTTTTPVIEQSPGLLIFEGLVVAIFIGRRKRKHS